MTVVNADCLEFLQGLPDNHVTAVVTDPPYGLSKTPDMAEVLRHWLAGDDYEHRGSGFMGKTWDSFVPGPSVWKECLRVLKPGGVVLAFSGSRTFDLQTMALRLAGFEVRDVLSWLYATGFPKGHDISKAIDKAAGHWRGRAGEVSSGNAAMGGPNYERTPKGDPITAAAAAWEGMNTALKPAWEPIILAMKPTEGTFAANALEHGVAGINVDGCRVGTDTVGWGGGGSGAHDDSVWSVKGGTTGLRSGQPRPVSGRWPANVVLDEEAAEQLGEPSRFFYCPKASRKERDAGLKEMPVRTAGGLSGRADGSLGKVSMRRNVHPTVKPIELMRWLVRMVKMPSGTLVLDPFTGSGSTGVACALEGVDFLGIEREAEYADLANRRIEEALKT